jgi:hypothetical protein
VTIDGGPPRLQDDFLAWTQEARERATESAAHYPEEVRGFVFEMLITAAMSEFGVKEPLNRDWAHSSYRELVLSLGTVRTAPLILPDPYELMEARNCFGNAFEMATDYEDLTYVEGYARTSHIIVNHAWLEDRNGRIIDPTWQDRLIDHGGQATYAGIKFSLDVVMRRALETESISVLHNDWMLGTTALEYGFVMSDGVAVADIKTPRRRI